MIKQIFQFSNWKKTYYYFKKNGIGAAFMAALERLEENANEVEYIYEAPADMENYTTQEFLFVLWKEEAGWRFNTFHLFF